MSVVARVTIEPRRPTATVAISRRPRRAGPWLGDAGRSGWRRRRGRAGSSGVPPAGSRGSRASMPSARVPVRGLAQAGLERTAQDALLGDDAGDQLGRRDVEGRVADLGPGRGDADAAELEDLVGGPLLDHDRRAVRRGEVDRAGRGADVERDPVPGGEHGQRVVREGRADLVGGVAVGRDPVRADQHDVHLAERHQVPGGHIGEQRVRDAGLGQLPGRQPRALQVRSRLVDPDVDRRDRHGAPPGRCRARSRTGRRPAARCCSGSGCGPGGRRASAGSPARTRPAGRGRWSPRRRSRRPRRASRARSRRRPRTAPRPRCSGPGRARPPSAG